MRDFIKLLVDDLTNGSINDWNINQEYSSSTGDVDYWITKTFTTGPLSESKISIRDHPLFLPILQIGSVRNKISLAWKEKWAINKAIKKLKERKEKQEKEEVAVRTEKLMEELTAALKREKERIHKGSA